jgi:hypothetical protein
VKYNHLTRIVIAEHVSATEVAATITAGMRFGLTASSTML